MTRTIDNSSCVDIIKIYQIPKPYKQDAKMPDYSSLSVFHLTILLVLLPFLVFTSGTTIDRPVFLESYSRVDKVNALPYHVEMRIHDPTFDHSVVLGSHDKASEFSQLPVSEAKRRLEAILSETDSNGDQIFNEREMYEWILQSFRSLDREAAEERFKSGDTDDSDQFSWHEYLMSAFRVRDTGSGSISTSLQTLAGKPVDDVTVKRVTREHELWEEADADDDDHLSLEEFYTFNYPGLSPGVLEVALKQQMTKDRNGDGFLSFEELYSASDYQFVPMEGRWLMAKVLNDLDKSGDNKITPEELLSYLANPYHNDVHRQVTHLMDVADDDLDGLLSFEEMLDNMDNFVGSSGLAEQGHVVDEL